MLFFSIFNRFLNLIVSSKDWLMTLTLAMTLAHDLASENQTNICREKFFHTNKYKCISLNVQIELPNCEGNGHVSPCSISNPDLF